jgi:hypothetical protein
MRMRRPRATLLAGLGLAALLTSGCISYSVRSSSSASSSGYGSGSGGGGGSTTGTGVPYPSQQPPGHDVYGGAPAPGANLAWDPALGVYRVTNEPGTYFDGHAFYRKGEYGWVARVDPQRPWQQITPEALPPGLRDR